VSKAQRIPSLDFTKGTLVLLMVLYHWLNYFTNLPWKYYDYLRFLTPSFIFITGFIISHVYLSKYAASDTRLSKRLFTRGLKLIAVFLVLNLARNFIVPVLGTGAPLQKLPSPQDIFAVFVSGNFPVLGGKLISFSILVPISYLLMLSGILTLFYKHCRYVFHFACALLLLFVSSLGLFGARSFNLEFITIGLLGVLTGFLPITTINGFGRHPYGLLSAYLCYTIAITRWNMSFPLLVVGVLLSVMAIYVVGACDRKAGSTRGEVVQLGKYSLLGYISQIAILQILSAGFHRLNLGFAASAISFFAAFALTIVTVEAVDRARGRTASVDKLYKWVFA